jgi:hypothetical protein
MRGHAQQDIFKVDVGREVNQFAALHERVEQRRAARALEADLLRHKDQWNGGLNKDGVYRTLTENGRLKKMVADRDLEIDVLKEITRKKW